VFIIVDTSERRLDQFGQPVARSTDGMDIIVRLPPGERFDTYVVISICLFFFCIFQHFSNIFHSQFVQIEGKVSGPNMIDAFRVQPVSDSFDPVVYNQAVDLVLGKFNTLFV